jgi:hypothetical protein
MEIEPSASQLQSILAASVDVEDQNQLSLLRKESEALAALLTRSDLTRRNVSELRSLGIRVNRWFNRVDVLLRGVLSYDRAQLDQFRNDILHSLNVGADERLITVRYVLDQTVDMLEAIPAPAAAPPSGPSGPPSSISTLSSQILPSS